MDLKLTWSKEDDSKKDQTQNDVIENAAKKLPYSKTKILVVLSQSVLELQKKLDSLSAKDEEKYSELETKFTEYDTHIDEKLKEHEDLINANINDKVKDYNDLIVEIKENVNTLSTHIDELEREIENTDKVDELRSEITRLNGKNVALETKMENLRSSVNAQLTDMQNKWFKGEGNQPSEPSTEEPETPTEEQPETNTDTKTTLDTASTSEPPTEVEDNKAVTMNNDMDSLLTSLRNIRI